SNQAVGQSAGPAGGALYLDFSAPTLHKNAFTGNEAFAVATYSTAALSRGGAICLANFSNPALGAPAGGENTFSENRALLGADFFVEGSGPLVNARSNVFTIFPPTSYYVSPLASFDVSGGVGLHPALTADVTVSPSGVDAEGAPGPLRTVNFALSRLSP